VELITQFYRIRKRRSESAKALNFMRLENADYNKVDNSIVYITDTGSDEFRKKYKNGDFTNLKL